MLTLYFSGTGNTRYIARLFSKKMKAQYISIEKDVDFDALMADHETIAICYPIYGSRVPRIMRSFVKKHLLSFRGKKIIILVTQVLFSGDGARVLTDLFGEESEAIEVIYAEHFRMPNNISNLPFFWPPNGATIERLVKRNKKKLDRVCANIKKGKIVRRGFHKHSVKLGLLQGKAWQGDSKLIAPAPMTAEHMALDGVEIDSNCSLCHMCVNTCPARNFKLVNGAVKPQGKCFVCYRCINRCPRRAIRLMRLPFKSTWHYWDLNLER